MTQPTKPADHPIPADYTWEGLKHALRNPLSREEYAALNRRQVVILASEEARNG